MTKVPQLAFVACSIKYVEVTLCWRGQQQAIQLAFKLGHGGGAQIEDAFVEVKAIQGDLNCSA